MIQAQLERVSLKNPSLLVGGGINSAQKEHVSQRLALQNPSLLVDGGRTPE